MTKRALLGKAPVTEAEFAELRGWLETHADRLYQQSLPSQVLDLAGGRHNSVSGLRHRLSHGPWHPHAGELVEDLRYLQARADTAVSDPSLA